MEKERAARSLRPFVAVRLIDLSGGGFGYQHRLFAAAFGISGEIESAVDAPDDRDGDCDQRLSLAAQAHDRSDDVEGHATEVGDRAEHRYDDMLEAVKGAVLAEGDDADDVGQAIDRECAEVRNQGD